MNASVVVWDHQNKPPAGVPGVLCWQSYASESGGVSVPRYLENHAERLRAKYLAFIHDLGECRIGGKRVVEHLDHGDGFSFWWMAQLSEKNPFKSPRIYDCLRLMALEEILFERKPADLTLDSADRNLAQAIQRLCQNLRINFVWRPGKKPNQKWSLRSIYLALPYPMQGLISLRHLVMKWPLRKLQNPQWFSGNDAVFLCSYFFNLDAVSCAEGQFYSRQWEELPRYLQGSGKHTNWIQHFLRSPGVPDVKTGLNCMLLFNRDADKQGCHAFPETYLSWGVILRALKKWVWLNAASWRLRKISCAFTPHGTAVWLWPLLRDDWQTSLTGPAAISNCFWVELFDAALKDMPYQKMGLYLWENQGWESALLRAWRRHGHGEIIGVPHSTIAFWHLNNFDDDRTLSSSKSCAKPLPNHWAINGPMAWKALAETGYPVEQFIEVEALRFQYLRAYSSGNSKRLGSHPGSTHVSSHGLPKKLLIIGGGFVDENRKMLQCVEAALKLIDAEISLTVKPHPVCRIRKEDCPILSFELTDRPLAEIMRDFDFAFSCNTSSAGLDALLAGLPVVVFLKDGDFNHSPLRGIAGVQFVSTAQELVVALQSSRSPSTAVEDFFWLDNQLPRWRRLLSK